ncbi:Neutral alpha-glucosidase AB [Thelohanellus kitauei]|uniref:Neutral alpha-glucosidase AB n=1 Tax=Thelohanellus kitauei TaxID=669202 RepID=A0A0C2J353_THEKT|nr:Neutral alpha-glucosidase AB [Thelohanellus kitauei]
MGGLVRSKNQLRPFLLSRSFYAGSQKYGAIWSGDNLASWDHLKITIPMLLSLSIAGIPFVGADVAGFFKDPEPELFVRWYQAASMQPFFRAHAHIETKRREPWSYGSPTTELVRDQILRRYRYLPYLYTLFYEAHHSGTPVMRPLWYEFPKDPHALQIEDSYMLGPALLIKPIVTQGDRHIDVYFPSEKPSAIVWFAPFNNKFYKSGSSYSIEMHSMSDLPMFQKAGTIVPTWERQRRTSSKMHDDPLTLHVVVDENDTASGTLYLDDTETFKYEKGEKAVVSFDYSRGILSVG